MSGVRQAFGRSMNKWSMSVQFNCAYIDTLLGTSTLLRCANEKELQWASAECAVCSRAESWTSPRSCCVVLPSSVARMVVLQRQLGCVVILHVVRIVTLLQLLYDLVARRRGCWFRGRLIRRFDFGNVSKSNVILLVVNSLLWFFLLRKAHNELSLRGR